MAAMPPTPAQQGTQPVAHPGVNYSLELPEDLIDVVTNTQILFYIVPVEGKDPTHPVAVARLCEDWLYRVRAIMFPGRESEIPITVLLDEIVLAAPHPDEGLPIFDLYPITRNAAAVAAAIQAGSDTVRIKSTYSASFKGYPEFPPTQTRPDWPWLKDGGNKNWYPWRCAACHAASRFEMAKMHPLRWCPVPTPEGDVVGCPVCNTLKHDYDDCPYRHRRIATGADPHQLKVQEDVLYLVRERGGLPPIRTVVEWPRLVYGMAGSEEQKRFPNGYPATKAFAR